jgi:hypothetical protein
MAGECESSYKVRVGAIPFSTMDMGKEGVVVMDPPQSDEHRRTSARSER